MKTYEHKKVKISDLKPYEKNSRLHSSEQLEQIKESIKKWGFTNPLLIDEDFNIIAGHGRLEAVKMLNRVDFKNNEIKEIPAIIVTDLSEEERKALVIADNKIGLNASWDYKLLQSELKELELANFDLDLIGFNENELNAIFNGDFIGEINNELAEIIEESKNEKQEQINEDIAPTPKNTARIVKNGDLIELGSHRVLCGDSTNEQDIKKLMNGELANLVFTDPPYGMKKEKDGIANDNLNYDDLLEFNKKWIPLSFDNLVENGSWYCWGIDEPLMDIYSEILKPMKKENKITFRQMITWHKGIGAIGQNSDLMRMYPTADEKCLFVIKGVQGFNTNSDNYFQGWEPIRKYLYDSRVAMGWDIPTMKTIVGHSGKSRDHWTSTSQWVLPTEKVYNKMKEYAEKQRKEQNINNNAFKKEYEEIKKEYDKIKQDFHNSRAYFNNTHDNMNSVWQFFTMDFGKDKDIAQQERELTGDHATPKPLKLCERAIRSSSRENELVLDLFLGSGSTLIASHFNNRKCYGIELSPIYCEVIINRFCKLTNTDIIRINKKEIKWELVE